MGRGSKRLSKEELEEVDSYLSSRAKSSNSEILSNLDKKFKPNKKQQEFSKVINSNTITICHGSAGTGKTISSLYTALQDVIKNNKKLILIRPIFESASQSLGLLPGELSDKLAPHKKAFMYNLEELLGPKVTKQLIENGTIKFEVLNFLKGATLSNSVIVCDEAQNMTVEEMILVITRIGKSSKVIFTGDFYQTDLRKAKGSIMDLSNLLKEVKGVSKFTFTNKDVMRNSILVEVTKIWEDYKDSIGDGPRL